MKAWGSPAAVIAAIREEAAEEIARLEHESEARVAAIRAGAIGARQLPDHAERLAEARRHAADQLTEEDWQDTLAAISDRDAWISAVAEHARRTLGSLAADPVRLFALAREAITALPATSCELVLPDGSPAASDPRWKSTLETTTGKRVAISVATVNGCLARTVDGRITFDNTIAARDARFRTEWRAALARAYDAAVATRPVAAATASAGAS